MRTLSVMTCVRSVESGTGSGPMPAMKMLNVDRTEGNIGVHSPLFIISSSSQEIGPNQWSQPPPILFSTDFDGFFYWDECSQKWCNSLLISSQFSTMNCIIINWSWLNSLLIIIKYSTIHWENAIFSTESIRILYWFWRDSLLIWGTFSTVRLN